MTPTLSRARGGNPRRARRGAASGLLLLAAGCGDAAADRPLRIALVGPDAAATAAIERGARLGVEEAARTGELVGRGFELVTLSAATPEDAAEAVRRAAAGGAFAVLGGADEAGCRAMAAAAEAADVLFLNVGCRSGDGRARPGATTIHVEASRAMYDSVAEEATGGGSAAPPVLWHPGLRRFGAEQLNERFRRRHGARADAPGWAGWMAVKLAAESALRTGTTDAARLVAFLTSDTVAFDGHKGEPLAVDPRTRQLRQPLYAVGGGDGPRAGPASGHGALPTLAEARIDEPVLVFVSNEGSSDITVIGATSRRALARVPVGDRPRGIHVGPRGDRLYVAVSDDAATRETDADAILEIDPATGAVLARHRAGSDPEQFALTLDGRTLVAANEDAGTATLTDLAERRATATLTVGIEPEGVAVSPDGRWAYVTAETSNTVSVIDLREDAVVASFLVDVRPRAAAFAPDGRRAFVTNEISGTLSIVDAERHAVLATVPLEDPRAKPVGVAVSPDGARVYVANGHAHSLAVLDARTGRAIATVPVGRRPWGVAVSPDGRTVYTANGGSDDVSVVDAESLTVVATIPVGERPWGVAILARRG